MKAKDYSLYELPPRALHNWVCSSAGCVLNGRWLCNKLTKLESMPLLSGISFFLCAFVSVCVHVHLVVGLLRGAGGELVDVRPRRRQVSGQVPHLHSEVLAARHHERGFDPGQRHTQSCRLGLRLCFRGEDGRLTWSR